MNHAARPSITTSKLILGALASLAVACGGAPAESPQAPEAAASGTSAPTAPKKPAKEAKFDKVPRMDFNRIAVELDVPIFWTEDKNKNGALDADELAVYWGLEPGATVGEYVGAQGFTDKTKAAYERIAKRHAGASVNPTGMDEKEGARRLAVLKELAQGRITLVTTDLSKAPDSDKKFVAAITKAAEMIERLYGKQQGTIELAAKVPSGDLASKALFFRNQGARCVAPKTQDDPNCSAVPDAPKGKLSGLYPKAMLSEPNFCEELSKKEAGKKDKTFMDPFTVVGGDVKAPTAVPYHEAFKDDVTAISNQLKAAADALGASEPALKAYVLAASQAFLDDKWWPADEAWAKMDAKNSKYYLRIAPDEVYSEPCSTKALYHVSFGLINQGSLKWQSKLDPLKAEMEKTLAAMAGAPYKARDVSFKLPDFVDIAINAGDSRNPSGATIGQSLPNFGPVANEGRGRTVAMTNFYTDPDSIAALRETTESLLCKDTMAKYTSDQEPQLMSTVLHEAAHNLGPAHQYKVNGKIDREAFGGPLASTLEELKAQTAALFLTDWLVTKKEITPADAEKAHIRDLTWAFGHISRGMYDENKHPKNYSQLAAIQLGWLMQNGAITWNAGETAANGNDKGCFQVALDKYQPAVKSLMIEVAQIKGKGDKARADKLIKNYVDVTGDKKAVHDVITERMLRAPKASFVYSVKFD